LFSAYCITKDAIPEIPLVTRVARISCDVGLEMVQTDVNKRFVRVVFLNMKATSDMSYGRSHPVAERFQGGDIFFTGV
jgi:hypothetical protein